ncbi:MAG: NAD(P)/FAD-dependent oxidoreductase [Bacteroidetes bacterium]|nr:MAG: NAD(P)/FAD-dependent oxidoreductase [Bacteroidota bacterium]TAG90444.1 MAG: NAD(P)/FAD-dependent oxidoreductase [Bacteroidota bacterium]
MAEKIIVVGAGAAGYFAAIHAAENKNYEVILIEKMHKVLSKVKISGGGRCNVTNACVQITELSKNYPRGEKFLKKSFQYFYTKDTIEWFENRDVKLKTEPDNRMFPTTDDSQTIVDVLEKERKKQNIQLVLGAELEEISINSKENFVLKIKNQTNIIAKKIIITTGGSPKTENLDWIKKLGSHTIIPCLPSLFTFNMPKNPILALQGVAYSHAQARIQGTNLVSNGAILITHWGMSGPAILRLSAWGARILAEKNYDFVVSIQWIGDKKPSDWQQEIEEWRKSNKQMKNIWTDLPKRLWIFLLEKANIDLEKKANDLKKNEQNKLIELLTNDTYQVKGKTTFKEEFVTCGGVSLEDVNHNTMESKKIKNLFFAGEVLDIDGITGGFNFQAAWTTGFLAGKNAGI